MSSLQKTSKQAKEIIEKEISKATIQYFDTEIAARNLEDFFRREGIDPYRYIVMELDSYNPTNPNLDKESQ